MGIAIGVLLALLAIVVVIFPFIRSGRRAGLFQGFSSALDQTEEASLDEIRTLQLERELGRVDEEEYQARLRDYRVRAALLLRERDMKLQEVDAELEAEILAARSIADDSGRASDESAEPLGEPPRNHENDETAS